MMRKLLILSVGLLASFLAATQDINDIMQEFQKIVGDTSEGSYGNNKSAGKYYDIRGLKMYAEVYGSGQPLLIIHGNGGSINNFVYNIPYFREKYKVIIADSRAQGRSKDPGDSLSYEMMADDYSALLDAMKVDSAYVIGWSDGGTNGLLLAIRHPQKVKMLAVTGASLVPDTTAVPQAIWDMVARPMNELKAKTNRTEEENKAYKLYRLLLEQPHISNEALHTIKCPTLVIGGDHDVIRVEHTLRIYKNIPRSYLWILPASGHSTPVVYKDDFNRVVDRFFSNPYKEFSAPARFF